MSKNKLRYTVIVDKEMLKKLIISDLKTYVKTVIQPH